MANLLIRDVPEKIVSRLKNMAKKRNMSLQQELKSILVATATQSSPGILKQAAKIRAKLQKKGIRFSDSAALLREDRSR
jgi:plasmid stability protein